MATFLTFCHPTFYPVFLPPPFQVFPEAESVVVAELSPEVVVLVAEPEVFALVLVAELSPEIVVLVVEPEAVFVVDLEVSELGVVSVAVVSVAVVFVADAAEPRASVDIAVAFAVLVPVSVVVAEVDSSGRPMFLAFPNVCSFPNCSNSVEAFGEESVHSSTGARTNYGLCSILSNLGLHQNKILEDRHNKPSPGYSNVNDTNDLPMDATTNHPRKRCLHLYQEQRRHKSQVSRSPRVVRQIR